MNHGGVLRSPFRPSSARRAALLLVVSAALVSACGTSGGVAASSGDGTPATTAAPASTGDVVSCFDLDPTTWKASPTTTSLVGELQDGKAPGLAMDGPAGPPDASGLFITADEFLAQSNVPDPAARKKVMEQAGYAGGIKAQWTQGNGFTMQVLNFADAPAAASYVQARLSSICGQGGTQAGVTMFDEGDGITWTDPLGATHGEFIFGGTQVSLTTCGSCDPVSVDTMQAWHDAFVKAYATGPAAPIS